MRVPVWAVPLLIAAVTVLSLLGAGLFTIPSFTMEYEAPEPSSTVVELLVDGVRCVDTAAQAGAALADVAGVARFVAYASRNLLEVTFDPQRCSVQQIVSALEGPVFDEERGEFLFGIYRVAEIDGIPTAR